MTRTGSIILGIFFSFLPAWAQLQAYVDATSVQAGDEVRFTIETDQENTVFPDIQTIGDFPVLAAPTSRSIQSVNGHHSASLKKSYVFHPTRSMTIPSYTVRINGAAVKTPPIEISVSKRSQTLDKPYRFDIRIDNATPYVGQEVALTATFTIDQSMSLEGLDLYLERLEGFIVDSSDKNWRGNRVGDKIIFERVFRLYPQKAGKMLIDHLPIVGLASDGRVRMFFGENQKIVAYSNALELDVQPLPSGVSLVGDFALKVRTDRFKTKAGEPVNLSIELSGEGSLESFRGFSVNLNGVTSFEDKPTKNSRREEGKLLSSIVYRYALVSDHDYTIPPFTLKFLNPENGKVKELSSSPVTIEVEGGETKPQSVRIERDTPSENGGSPVSTLSGWIYGLVGLTLGIVIGLLLPRPSGRRFGGGRSQPSAAVPMAQRVKKASDAKGLLALLLPYVDRPDIRKIVDELEKGVEVQRLKEIKVHMHDYFKQGA